MNSGIKSQHWQLWCTHVLSHLALYSSLKHRPSTSLCQAFLSFAISCSSIHVLLIILIPISSPCVLRYPSISFVVWVPVKGFSSFACTVSEYLNMNVSQETASSRNRYPSSFCVLVAIVGFTCANNSRNCSSGSNWQALPIHWHRKGGEKTCLAVSAEL